MYAKSMSVAETFARSVCSEHSFGSPGLDLTWRRRAGSDNISSSERGCHNSDHSYGGVNAAAESVSIA